MEISNPFFSSSSSSSPHQEYYDVSSSSSSSPPEEYYDASSSFSSSPPEECYDVFLSFRGVDTRKNFTGHLHGALKQRGLHTFFDVDKLERGEFVNEGLLNAIEDSNCWIIVLSENYASSHWCLIELARIVECMGTSRHVLPIFFHVKADDLQNLSGSFEETMKNHEKYHDSEKVQSWRNALKTVGHIAGWNVIKDTTDESEFIVQFIQKISRKLEVATLNASQHLVGIEPRLEKFKSHMVQRSDSVQFIGICGMGGIDALAGNVIGEENWFGNGSIIIVTTKNRGVLNANNINAIYDAVKLDYVEDRKLFCRKVFQSDIPPEAYIHVCDKMIKYANGLPLALIELGSGLNRESSVNDFENKFCRLKTDQGNKINSVLKVSFDDLHKIEREIFLDIACFFNKYNKDHVIVILDSMDSYGISNTALDSYGISNTAYGIKILVEGCLLSIDQHDGLDMHDLLQDMGRKIVRNEYPNEPRRQSRIWDVADLNIIAESKTRTDKVEVEVEVEVEAIVTAVEPSKKLTSFQAISQMEKLRLLMIFDPDCGNDSSTPNHVNLSKKYLRYLQWHKFPYKCFPSSCGSFDISIKKLWKKHDMDLFNLKIIDLSHSQNLTKFEDFKVVPNLERLILEGCIKLSEIHDSITSLEKLIKLNLASCKSLKKFPDNIKEDFGHLKRLKEVDVRDSGIRHLPSSIFLIENLKVLCDEEVANSSVRESLINPPKERCVLPDNLRNLTKLDLSDRNLKGKAFPEHFGNLVSLKELNLSKNPFSGLPSGINGLSTLTYLNLMYCKFLRHLSPDQLPSSLQTIRVDYCTSLTTLLDQSEPCHIQCSTYCVDCTELVKRRGGEMTALTSLKRYIQSQDPTHSTRSFDIVIPGSKIPTWFTTRSSGSSLSINLDSDNKWIGIAFSLCFPANSWDDEFSCTVKVRGQNKEWNFVTEKIYRRSSNHLWLSYSPRDFYSECPQNGCYCLDFSFYVNEPNNSCTGPCGVRLVYEKDREELNKLATQNRNQSPEDEEDGEHYSRSERSKNQKGIFGSILVATIVASLVVALRHKPH
ncbi:hypothetical protein FNV43_RR20430 [Rhamnella rubrinervis]|uniref:TIR domain-containing protein n=1 Tax=Rhamnella rubrinervis TaxID=2594499 RepID=A0A8K0E153_9ROSA|nr:hypothetical protein FNV43_RR20430 [Rhamnella rubrinervis]